jgi:hypothetical protein
MKGVTIKDALDAIYKQYKKKVCARLGCVILFDVFVPLTTNDPMITFIANGHNDTGR